MDLSCDRSGQVMAERLSLDDEIHKLKLGKSFDRSGNTAFHSLRYDFKPASVDTTKVASLDIGQNNSVNATVPTIEGAGSSHIVYKGNKRPSQKECVLIIDHVTGEITLEKLANTIQLKKTRIEGSSKAQSMGRPLTPSEQLGKKSKDAKNSPSSKHNQSKSQSGTKSSGQREPEVKQTQPTREEPPGVSPVEEMSASSDSDSDSEEEPPPPPKSHPQNPNPGFLSASDDEMAAPPPPENRPSQVPHTAQQAKQHAFSTTLSEDLQLSDSGSDSD